MNMTDIQCFIKVTELMSFTKAAEALYTSQQAVSLHIKHLESTYKVQLFERKPSLKLTPSGGDVKPVQHHQKTEEKNDGSTTEFLIYLYGRYGLAGSGLYRKHVL